MDPLLAIFQLLPQQSPDVSTPPLLPPLALPEPYFPEVLKRAVAAAGLIAGIVVGLVDISKRVGLPPRGAPAAALGWALLLTLGWEMATPTHPPVDWWLAAVCGLVAGLMASGAYATAQSFTSYDSQTTKPGGQKPPC